jgi:DNA-binding MarR family transcriptional regulator
MAAGLEVHDLAGALRLSIGLLTRRLRQAQPGGELTWGESAALGRLDREGPTTAAALARLEHISPQSMGATLAALEERRLIERSDDPQDGRRAILSVTDAGRRCRQDHVAVLTEQLAHALATGFTSAELEQLAALAPLLERLAQDI